MGVQSNSVSTCLYSIDFYCFLFVYQQSATLNVIQGRIKAGARARVLCQNAGPSPDGHTFLLLSCLLCLSGVNSSRLVSMCLLQHSRFHKLHITKILHFPKLRVPINCGPWCCSTHSTREIRA